METPTTFKTDRLIAEFRFSDPLLNKMHAELRKC